MTDIGSSLIAASLIMGMVSVPVASQTLEDTETFSQDMPDISESEQLQEDVVTNQTSEGFVRQVSTAFQEIRTEITSEGAETLIQDAESELSIDRDPESTVWKLKTPEADLKIEQRATETVETVQTPYGTLEKRTVKGATYEDFEGTDRSEIEQEKERLKDLMEEKKEELRSVSKDSVSDHYSDKLDLEVQPEGDSEHLKVENTGSETLDLENWEASDRGNYHYVFENVELAGDSKLYLYSNDEEDVETVDEDAVNIYDSGIRWNQQGDQARLKGSEGEELVTESY